MVFDSIALTALSLALSFGVRDGCQPSIPEPVPIYQFTLTWPHLTQNIKAYQMKKIYPTVTSKKRTILGHEGWESEALNLSGSAAPHAANMGHALQGSRRYRWPAYYEMKEDTSDGNTLWAASPLSRPDRRQRTNRVKAGRREERLWTVSMACREWAPCHMALTTVRLAEEEREGWNKNRRATDREWKWLGLD